MRLKHFLSVFLTLFVLSVGQMWGATTVTGAYKLVTSTTGIAAGDTVLLVNKAGAKALTGISTTSTKYGTLADVSVSSEVITLSSADVEELAVEAGSASGSFAFKGTGDISGYLQYTGSSNSLSSNATKAANTSWTLNSYAAANGMTIANKNSTNRIIRFNSDRFACYTNSTGTLVNLYKKAYKVTYNGNGSTGGSVPTDANYYYKNASVTAKSNSGTLVKSGYTFTGWNTKANGTGTAVAATGSATFTLTYNTTLYAQWEEDAPAYTITPAINDNSYGNVSLSGVVVTATPNACYEYASPAYTVSPAGKATVTQGTGDHINEFTVSDVIADVTVTINLQEKAAGKTVNFDAGPGVPASASLTEDCAGAGVTLPTVNTTGVCKGWGTFAGWRATAIAAKDSSTTTNPGTLFAAGSKYVPNSDGETLYAVYSKVKSGGTAEETASVTISDYATAHSWGSTSSSGQKVINIDANITATASDGGNTGKFYTTEWRFYQTENATLTISAATGCTLKSATFTYGISNTGVLKDGNTTVSSGSAYSISGTSKTFSVGNSGSATNGQVKFTAISITYDKPSSTTYYCSDPNCCTELGQIKGSVSLTQTTATLTWDDLANVAESNPYAVTYRTGDAAFGNANVGSITTNAQGKKTCTITGLDCGTAYDFKIAVTAASNYCDAEQVLENKSTSKWNISYDLSGTVALSAGPAQGANACGEITATFSKNALYTFPDEITVTIGGDEATVGDDYLWDADQGTLVINEAAVTGNVVVTIAGQAPANPIVTPNPTALSFAQVKKGADVPAAQDIALEGHNLTAALTVESSNTDLYVVSLKSGSLTPDGNKDASPVITVTPQEGITSTAGDKNATITISGGGLAEAVVVNVTFNVQETYTVNWYVNGTKIDANSKTDVTGTAVTAPSDFSAFIDCSDFHFIGWAADAIEGGSSDEKPELVTPITAIGTTATTNYYAVFAEGTPAGTKNTVATLDGSKMQSHFTSSQVAYTAAEASWVDSEDGITWSARFNCNANTPWMQLKNDNAVYFKIDAAQKITKVEIKATDASCSGSGCTMRFDDHGNCTNALSLRPTSTTTTAVASGTPSNKELTLVPTGTNSTLYLTAAGTARIWEVKVTYSEDVPEDFSKYYTTCPHVKRVNLSAAEVSNGSISFEQSGSAVTNVRTDGGEDVEVDVVPDPATGYELTGVALSGVAGASYAAGVITIPANAEGTLVATATFAQANYTVTMAQTGGASAELSADQTNKHYNDVITVTAEDKAGYVFKGWSASPAVTFANAKALETTFSMPNGNVTVTAAYAKVYTPAEALALDDLTDSVYVEGVISQVDEVSTQYKNATYWISADGTTTNQIKIYRGKHINKADVTADNAAQIAVGNKVRVRGKLSQSSNVNQFGQSASYITVLVEKTLSALTIVGDASVTTYDVGDSFDKTGLSLSATYNTGYVQANYTGTTITSNYDAPTTFTAGVTSVTVSAEEGLISTSRDIPVTVSSAVLDHVEISAAAQTEFWAKEQYKEPLLDAYLTDEPATVLHNVTGVSNTTGLDMSEPEDKSVIVTYTRKAGQEANVEYNFTVKPVVVDEAHAHSVATAREIIDVDKTDGEDLDLELAATKTHVVGVVTSVTALTGTNAGKYTIVIKDQTDAAKVMTLYQVTLKSGITSVAQDDIIKAYGNLYYHSQSSKYEINTGGEVVAVVRTPNLTVADVAEMEINITADLGVDDLTIDKDGSEGDITFSCSDAAVTIVNNKLHAAEAGEATVTATIAADGIYTSATTTFHVTVIAERTRYAITMDANGGSGDDPEYAKQLPGATVNLPANPYSKANSAFAAWVVTETVSGDAVTVTDGHFTMPAAAVTIQATWNDVETCAISFMVSGSEVATADAPQTAAYSLAGVEHPTVPGFTFLGWSETEYEDETATMPTIITSYIPDLNQESKTLYGIYSQVVGGANQHYVLDYADENLATNTNWGDAYSTVYPYTAADGGEWTIKAYKQNGIQINTNVNNPYIKVPNCAAKIIQISLTCNSDAKNAVKFAESVGGDALAIGTESTSQTLDLSGKTVTTGYILPSGNCRITHIDVEYSGNVTYYTSSPVTRYNVTYAKGDATGVTGLCEAQRHTAGNITLCDAPTCADKDFAKWSDGTSLYNAGAEYTLSADVTFTATWTPKPKYTVTYTANGGTGTAPAVEEYMEGETVTVKANSYFSKPGFVYAGWQVVYNDGTDHIITPNEDGEFEMVAYNVTIKALWEEPSNQKWVRVESTDELDTENGTNYIIVASQANAAMAALSGSYYESVGIVKTGNYLNGPESMTKVTLAAGSEEGKLAMKNGTKYLYSTSAKSIGERDDSFDWTITISEGVATINAGTAGKLQFNSGSPRFTTYTSAQQAVAIYREKALTPIDHDDMTEADVNTYDDVEIAQDKTWTVSNEIEVGDVHMKEGAVIANSATVKANDLYFKASHGKSNQIFDLSKITIVSNMYYDFQLCDGDVDANYWYSISVPFDVDLNSGVFQADGTPMVNRQDFEVWGYNTALRAQTQSNGWERVKDDMMHAGKAYLIGFNPGQANVIRLKAAAGWKTNLFSGTSMSVVSTGGSGDHDNWNGLANPSGRYIDVDTKTSVFNNNTHGWDSYDPAALQFNFVVGTAFFVQSADAIAISNVNHHNEYRAPKRVDDTECAYAVRITRDEATSFDNQIIVRASEEATGEYTQGHDMLTMNGTSSNTAALLWTENYGGKRLAIEEAAWLNDQASYVLKIYAPKAGTYSISVAETKENADLYLTQNGSIIWNLSMGEYTIDLNKGTTSGYGLKLVRKAPNAATGVDEIDGEKANVQKVLINEHVYILRGGEMYDVTGKMVK